MPRCVETAFFKWIRRSNEDVLSTIFFTLLFGGFAWPAWSHLKCMNYRLDELSKKIEVLEHAVRVPIIFLYAFKRVVDELHLVIAFYFPPSNCS